MTKKDNRNQKWIAWIFVCLVLGAMFWILYNKPFEKADPCLETRAAIDIGSASTKMKVAMIDFCAQRIVFEIPVGSSGPIENGAVKVDYRSDLKANNNQLSDQIIQQGVASIKELLTMAKALGAKRVAAVATEAFRASSNQTIFFEALKNEVGLQPIILSQNEEATLGYLAAMTRVGSMKNALVWDIGGGSMQIVARGIDGSLQFLHSSKLASVGFKEMLISLQGKDARHIKSPNPIGTDALRAALKSLAVESAKIKSSPAWTQFRHKDSGIGLGTADTRVLGIGSVFGFSVKGQLKKSSIHEADLEAEISNVIQRSDSEFSSKYAETEASNLILVLGLMKGLGIETVDIVPANLTDGMLTDPRYFPISN